MQKLFKTLIILSILTISFSSKVKAEEITTINALIENAKALDQSEVTVQGEVIGECLERGDYSWININDGTNAIGIWIKSSDAIKITRYGNYQCKGDIVKITGTFYRACKEHGGEAELHNKSMQIIKTGYSEKEQVPPCKILAAVFSLAAALLLGLIFIKQARKNSFTIRLNPFRK